VNYIEVFYERLTNDPESEMRRVCDFVGLKFDEAVLSVSRKPGHTGSKHDMIVKSMPSWNTYFRERQIRILENIAGETLADLGYEVKHVKGDHNPSRPVMWFWALRDYMRIGLMVLWWQATTPKKQRWDNLSGLVQSAIRQILSSRF
jgi:hypothetical protein